MSANSIIPAELSLCYHSPARLSNRLQSELGTVIMKGSNKGEPLMNRCPKELNQLTIPLLEWFRDHQRTLPWRSDPTPYHVWVSEIMLQQTRVAAVQDYYRRFIEALPTVTDLAQVEEDQLLKLWQGLGYYNRARNLQKAARQIVDQFDGQFPGTYENILTLPGVGEYTAGAIASIAFGLPEPAVDGNVLRVVTRVTGDASDISRPDTKKAVRSVLAEIIPLDNPGGFNQALMELGALVCLPNGAPNCVGCPAAAFCVAHREDKTMQLPVKAAKKPRKIENRRVYLIFHQGQVALRRRPGRGLLAGLWEFPNELEEAPAETWGLEILSRKFCGVGRHIFTHREWHMTGQLWQVCGEQLPEGWVWADGPALRDKYAIPNAFSSFLSTIDQYISHF